MTSQDRPPPPGGASAPWLALYHFEGCPYCTKVRRTAARLGVALELRDVRQDPAHRADLIAALGRPRVPVLRIEDADGAAWLPESSAIVDWLREQAGAEPREGPASSCFWAPRWSLPSRLSGRAGGHESRITSPGPAALHRGFPLARQPPPL